MPTHDNSYSYVCRGPRHNSETEEEDLFEYIIMHGSMLHITTVFLCTYVREHILLFHNFYYHGIPINVDAQFLFRGYHHRMTKSDRTNPM